MIGDFIYKNRVLLLEWYLVSACVYIFMFSMNLGIIVLGMIIGFVNTYIAAPIIYSQKFGNDTNEIPEQKTIRNVLKSILICILISTLYYFVNKMFFETYLEPISFGLIYKIIDVISIKFLYMIRNR